jgi:hypothetical protein
MIWASVARQFEVPVHEIDAGGAKLEAWRERTLFVLAMWLSSRLVVVLGMQVLAPVPGWALFAQWDAQFYERIATLGYEYADDGKYHTLAFFPLYPLLTETVMALGIAFVPAGVIVNSVAFLLALWQMHAWAGERYGAREATWATAVMAFFPYSLFGTVTYTEGTFLLTTTAALRAYDAGRFAAGGVWGALATATRFPGCMLAPAMLLAARWEKRPRAALAAAIATGTGLLAFMVFCALRFESPIAFVHAQKGWANDAIYWPDVLQTIVHKRGLAIDSLLRVGLFGGSALLLWATRRKLSRVVLLYGAFTLGLLLAVNVQSLGRFVFALAPLSLALGSILAQRPRVGVGVLGVSALALLGFSVLWALGYWVA